MGEDLDGRADQYALAATAYHLLSGRAVFEHSNPTIVISRHLNATPGRLADSHPALAFVDPVLQQGLAKDPAERYPSCTEFAKALRVAVTAAIEAGANPGKGVSSQSPTQHATVPPVLRAAAAQTQAAAAPRQGPAESAVAPAVSGHGEGMSKTLLGVVAGAVIVAAAAVATTVAVAVMSGASDGKNPETPQPATKTSSRPAPTATVTPTTIARPAQTPPPPFPSPAPTPAITVIDVAVSQGSAGVITRSGRTACQIMAADVGCEVEWEVATPLVYGSPATGVRIYANGQWEWAIGNMGNTSSFTTLNYGTKYRALGWTIEPSSAGTKFTNINTGHGIFVSTGGIDPF
ncbi:hypothetical protein BTO20_36510 (plasmid) [Mycobacterium dioxanotrophicus]|uniref:Protein kinase domain-containing protein n=1 Tax=Mycobacterium dioxanotrophicus TaxID=482462 RepID=A0A1Y0CGM9_9MYCO|nr:hypothetical protein [Mycobacterium dioxanotrophicus]ART74167.1 hypothetical protein BTO20_36510 [Mycobacterium dioxanotrophicus]